MRRVADRFIEISQTIRHENRDCWEADMFGLVIALHEAGLDVHPLDDLGVCNNWEGHRDRLQKIIHYPARMLDDAGGPLWFKQDYTSSTESLPWRRPPLPTRARNALESRLLEILHVHVDRQERLCHSPDRAWALRTAAHMDSR